MAYTKFEQTYVDAYLNNMYPDVEEEQSQDTMLAAAPTTELTGQVTVSGFQPQQVRTDVQPELGVARDSVVATGSDVIFLSDSGVRSLMRTIQEKSAPMRDISANVRDDLVLEISLETAADIKAVYSDKEAFYLSW